MAITKGIANQTPRRVSREVPSPANPRHLWDSWVNSNLKSKDTVKIFLLIASLLISNSLLGKPPAGYKLIWADEFNGNSVDESEWRYRLDKKGSSICSQDDVSITNGCMRINHGPREDRFGGGGLITKRIFKSGYFETNVNLDGGYGWHEAFWTWHPPNPENIQKKTWMAAPRIEIDCFEAKAHNGPNEYSYGVIQWEPVKGNLSRENHKAPDSLSSGFHTYGFEVTADYVAFFFDGKMINVTNLEDIKHSDFNVLLTSIATHSNAQTTNGCVSFDYLRCYDISPSDYPARRAFVTKDLAAPGGYNDTKRPAGTDLWIEAEKFSKLGSWTLGRDGVDNRTKTLNGRTKTDKRLPEAKLTASTTIKIPKKCTWRLWIRSRDVKSNKPGGRFFKAAVNGKASNTIFGVHGRDGYDWQDGGEFFLPAGNIKLELIDSSQYFVRCDRLLLTSDLEYVPSGPGGKENTEHVPPDGKTW